LEEFFRGPSLVTSINLVFRGTELYPKKIKFTPQACTQFKEYSLQMQAVAIDLLKGYQINYRGHGYEILQGNNAGVHSYRLNQKDRLDFTDENGILTIQSCKGHHNI